MESTRLLTLVDDEPEGSAAAMDAAAQHTRTAEGAKPFAKHVGREPHGADARASEIAGRNLAPVQ
jgi:hypothetical protein